MINKHSQLTEEQKEKYRTVIAKGYFSNYSLAWRTSTFAGVWLWKHPNRIAQYELFMSIVGDTPKWSDISDRNLRLFVEMLADSLCTNSMKTVCAELKAIINEYATEEDIPSQQYAKILTIARDASEAVYLSIKELTLIRNYTPKTTTERVSRDIFMIEALTGARHCDSERLTMNNVNTETQTIHYTAKKTRQSVDEPFHKWLIDYLPKSIEELNARPKVSQFPFNRAIRRICKNVGITVQTTIYRHGREQTAPKWQFVASHTARRSYATNLMLWGAEVGLISRFMGHTNTEMTLHYIKDTPNIPQKVLSFFNG